MEEEEKNILGKKQHRSAGCIWEEEARLLMQPKDLVNPGKAWRLDSKGNAKPQRMEIIRFAF